MKKVSWKRERRRQLLAERVYGKDHHQPGGHQRQRVEEPGEAPRLAHRQGAGDQRPARLVEAVDLQVVDLVDGVRRRVQEAGAERPEATVKSTERVSRAGSGLWTEPKAQTAPEMMPSSGGSRVNGRASWT